MKLSYNWLMELTGLDWSPEKVAERLTLCGTACEEIESTAHYMHNVVVAEVLDLKPIEGADKIRLATINDGEATYDIVCGAPNVARGMKVPLAKVGAELAGGIVIKKAKIRGIESSGMICSERELGISDSHAGIMELAAEAKPGQPLVEFLEYDDFIMTFELTPNRADSMSVIGVARDLAALAGTKVNRPTVNLSETAEKASDLISVRIDDPTGCPRYAARVIKHVKIGESPWWLQKKLITAGMRPINNVVDITNLVMLECGHPLHAFDLDRFGSNEVVVRSAKVKEKFTTLDGQQHELIPEVTMITNGKVGVAVGGVMGGLDSEVESGTTNILLEAAYFNPAMIRKSRRHLGLNTESSNRFEKGADPHGIEYAINRAAALMQDLCGGAVLSGVVDCYPHKIERRQINFRPERCNALLGTKLPVERMAEIFRLLELQVSGDSLLTVTIPTFRPDLEREVDLIEEVARIEGFDNIPDAQENIGPLVMPIHFEDKFKEEVRYALTGCGFDEIVHHGLVEFKESKIVEASIEPIRILNPVSEDLNVMRTSLAHTTLKIVASNIAQRNLDLKLFELGRVYLPNYEGDPIEEERLVLAVTGSTRPHWRTAGRKHDFYDIAGGLEAITAKLGYNRLTFKETEFELFDSGCSLEVLCNGKSIGKIGRVDGKLAERFDIDQELYLAELKILSFIETGRPVPQYEPLPIYPAALRDLAIVVDESIRAGKIVEETRKAAGELAESIEIFDLYRGKQIAKGKKSIAVAISYRSAEGNLSSEEVDKRQNHVISHLKKQFNAEIRDK